MPSAGMPITGVAPAQNSETILVAERNRVAKRPPLLLRSRDLSALPPWEQAEVAFGEARSFAGRRAVRYLGFIWAALYLCAWWSSGPERLDVVPLVMVLLAGVLLPAMVGTSLVRRRIHAEVAFRRAVHANAAAGV